MAANEPGSEIGTRQNAALVPDISALDNLNYRLLRGGWPLLSSCAYPDTQGQLLMLESTND